MKKFLCLIPLLLVGCSKDPLVIAPTNNPDINVSLLFEKDGVNVYRFVDDGYPVYFTTPIRPISWRRSIQEGKQTRTQFMSTGQ